MIVRVVLAIAILLGGCSTQQKIIQSFDRDIVDKPCPPSDVHRELEDQGPT